MVRQQHLMQLQGRLLLVVSVSSMGMVSAVLLHCLMHTALVSSS
jgi:hypothetical protein